VRHEPDEDNLRQRNGAARAAVNAR